MWEEKYNSNAEKLQSEMHKFYLAKDNKEEKLAEEIGKLSKQNKNRMLQNVLTELVVAFFQRDFFACQQ